MMVGAQAITEVERSGAAIHVTGIVQGVGFRPFVHNLADEYNLAGWVRNTSAGVDIRVVGNPVAISKFIEALRTEAPALALIDQIVIREEFPETFEIFEILESTPLPDAFQPISPDVSICSDCLKELFDPSDRRYLYPFINCTNCGPRFTIIEDIPYDRPNTTMAGFKMCPACAAEYSNPQDRRFHAQPIACPECGPQVWLETGVQRIRTDISPIFKAQRMLADGQILAIKGLGGFHLACDAANSRSVTELRRRKLRVDKPFALMMEDLETVAQNCCLDDSSIRLLTSRERPIVILARKPGSQIATDVAPGQDTLGVMLPYTPLHYLLFAKLGESGEDSPSSALVMTSGNLSEEPIAWKNEEARKRLSGLADGFLMHDRPIHTRCDDSVVRSTFNIKNSDGASHPPSLKVDTTILRHARGYAPLPIFLRDELPPILATGAELKNAFCMTRDRYALLSHHIGDLQNYETLYSFEESIRHFERLFRIQPEYLAYDLHPDYLATHYAVERSAREGIPAVGVQHHHAHIAACMAENQLSPEEDVIGIALDGTGYGVDGAVWGGEFLTVNFRDFHRYYHLDYAPLPGGDLAIREPWRMALSWLSKAGIDWAAELPPVAFGVKVSQNEIDTLNILWHQIASGFNAPPTSSMGRLFDGVASLIGVRQTVNYEAQAAIEMESQVDPGESGRYSFQIKDDNVDPVPIITGLLKDWRAGQPIPIMAARFHNTIAAMVCQVAVEIRSATGINQVVLSGGVWQNIHLISKSEQLLGCEDFEVIVHHQVPPNDGGIALGQALIAAYQLQENVECA